MIQLIKSMFMSINRLIVRSVTTDEVSATRISSYLILAPIQIMIFVVVIIEMFEFVHSVYTGHDYVLSNEFIITFGMVLSHHLAILFSRSKSQSRDELKGSTTTTSTTTETAATTTEETSTEEKTKI